MAQNKNLFMTSGATIDYLDNLNILSNEWFGQIFFLVLRFPFSPLATAMGAGAGN
jgi:hypothetical protein